MKEHLLDGYIFLVEESEQSSLRLDIHLGAHSAWVERTPNGEWVGCTDNTGAVVPAFSPDIRVSIDAVCRELIRIKDEADLKHEQEERNKEAEATQLGQRRQPIIDFLRDLPEHDPDVTEDMDTGEEMIPK